MNVLLAFQLPCSFRLNLIQWNQFALKESWVEGSMVAGAGGRIRPTFRSQGVQVPVDEVGI